jgi:predicted LPLAT superfamily acyltransferase
MSRWDGKSKGTVAGYKIFVFLLRTLGVRAAYGLLVFVAAYYYITQGRSNRAMRHYFGRRLGYPPLRAHLAAYHSYFTFGQTIIDKVAIRSGLKRSFTFEFDGREKLVQLLGEKRGGILISAHVGNFEIAEHFFAEIDLDCRIHLVTTDLEHSTIKDYLDSISTTSSVKFITLKDDLSHIFEINAALAENGLVCFTGDRYMDGAKLMRENLLGREATFPAGPFLIASRLNAPVIFVYVMKEQGLHYHLYARDAEVKRRDAAGLLKAYTGNLGQMLAQYPLQWFNYFDFWEDDEINAK